MSHILFITSSRIGDAILSTGLLTHALSQTASPLVTIAAAPLTLPLFEDTPGLIKLIPVVKKSYSRHWIALWQECRNQKWDQIIDIRGSLVSYFLKARQRSIWRSAFNKGHQVERLSAMRSSNTIHHPHIFLSPERLKNLPPLFHNDRPFLALAPIANWIGKQWPLESFKTFTHQFLAAYPEANVAFFCAPHERADLRSFLQTLPSDRFALPDINAPLLDIAAYLKSAALFMGNDSGLMHMSAAVQTTTLALFGPTNEAQYGPWGDGHCVIRTPENYNDIRQQPHFSAGAQTTYMSSLKPETVWATFQPLWEKYHAS